MSTATGIWVNDVTLTPKNKNYKLTQSRNIRYVLDQELLNIWLVMVTPTYKVLLIIIIRVQVTVE